jgi:hypothetical protein
VITKFLGFHPGLAQYLSLKWMERTSIKATGSIMKNINMSALALAIGLSLSVGAMAESMSKKQYTALNKKIDAEYKVAKKKLRFPFRQRRRYL